jgi:hypothetical protein
MSIINNKLITIFIDGDKNGFYSKNSIDRFKKKIKLNQNFNFDEIKQEFIKNDYNLELIDKNEEFIKFNITKKEIIKNIDQSKLELKNKLKNIIKLKSKKINDFNKYNQKNNIPEELNREYIKLMKMKINNNSIPSPEDVLKKPDEFRVSIPIILNNPHIKKIPQSHPYIKYLKSLANYLQVPNELLSLDNQLPDNIQSLINKSGIINDNKDNETDTEEEIICDKEENICNKEDDDIEIINSYDLNT